MEPMATKESKGEEHNNTEGDGTTHLEYLYREAPEKKRTQNHQDSP